MACLNIEHATVSDDQWDEYAKCVRVGVDRSWVIATAKYGNIKFIFDAPFLFVAVACQCLKTGTLARRTKRKQVPERRDPDHSALRVLAKLLPGIAGKVDYEVVVIIVRSLDFEQEMRLSLLLFCMARGVFRIVKSGKPPVDFLKPRFKS